MGHNTNDFFARLKTTFSSLTNSEKKVGEYILQHAQETIHLSLADIAAKCSVSDATALRFSRSLGYTGWFELKVALIRAISEKDYENSTEAIIVDTKNIEEKDLLQYIVQKSKETLDETLSSFNPRTFQKILDILVQSQRIMVIGSGTSGPIAHELYNRLFRLGLCCSVETDGILQIMHASLLRPEDVLFIISQSGDPGTIMRTAEVAKRNSVPIIAITGSRISPLTKLCDYLLLSVCHEPTPETITSRIAQQALVHTLYTGLSKRLSPQSQENEERIWDAFFPDSKRPQKVSTKKHSAHKPVKNRNSMILEPDGRNKTEGNSHESK